MVERWIYTARRWAAVFGRHGPLCDHRVFGRRIDERVGRRPRAPRCAEQFRKNGDASKAPVVDPGPGGAANVESCVYKGGAVLFDAAPLAFESAYAVVACGVAAAGVITILPATLGVTDGKECDHELGFIVLARCVRGLTARSK